MNIKEEYEYETIRKLRVKATSCIQKIRHIVNVTYSTCKCDLLVYFLVMDICYS
uniref:Uncharacterized protein n=1 Tax=Rhizophora mucronata TaxID=61149 RepID=A0A2P2LCV6_RHIMU